MSFGGDDKLNVILIGGVGSTLKTLEKLLEHDLVPTRVYGYEPENTEFVSGYTSLADFSKTHGVAYHSFKKINDHADEIAQCQADVIFVVGLSQLVNPKILSSAKFGCVGFHPTVLPKGRGRAPIAWTVLEERHGAANFFLMGDKADDGPIFVQSIFSVDESDDAETIAEKIMLHIGNALDEWLPQLKSGLWDPKPQNEAVASYYEVRRPEDSLIEWQYSAEQIAKLVRASTRPHPGAYSFVNDTQIRVWKVRVEERMPIRGVVGRILRKSDRGELLIQTGDGLIWLTEFSVDSDVELRVGMKFGYYPELEIFKLKQELQELREMIRQ